MLSTVSEDLLSHRHIFTSRVPSSCSAFLFLLSSSASLSPQVVFRSAGRQHPANFIPVTSQPQVLFFTPSKYRHFARDSVLYCVFVCVSFCVDFTPCGLVDGWPRERSILPKLIHVPLLSLLEVAIDLTLQFRCVIDDSGPLPGPQQRYGTVTFERW